MPLVENVLDHWIEIHSTSLDEADYLDHTFYFGLKTPRDILVTTCLSALTLGVSSPRNLVGTVGTRVFRYLHFDAKNKLAIKELPPAFDWNSERIGQCVSVTVRTTAFFANAFSLSTVYVFQRKKKVGTEVKAMETRRLVVYHPKTGKVVKTAQLQAAKSDLKKHWDEFKKDTLQSACREAGLKKSELVSLRVEPKGYVGSARVDLKSKRLLMAEKTSLAQFDRIAS